MRFPDPAIPILVLLAAFLLAAIGCTREEGSAREDAGKIERLKTLAGRESRRETSKKPPAEMRKPVTEQKHVAVSESTPKPEITPTKPKDTKQAPPTADPTVEIRKMATKAASLVDAGLRLWDEAKDAFDKGERDLGDGLLLQAYTKLEQAHNIYEDLDQRFPDTPFAMEIQAVEKHMYDIQKAIGTGE